MFPYTARMASSLIIRAALIFRLADLRLGFGLFSEVRPGVCKRYAVECTNGRIPTCEDYAKIHSRGWQGCQSSDDSFSTTVESFCDKMDGGCDFTDSASSNNLSRQRRAVAKSHRKHKPRTHKHTNHKPTTHKPTIHKPTTHKPTTHKTNNG